jgi:hypothetical protein
LGFLICRCERKKKREKKKEKQTTALLYLRVYPTKNPKRKMIKIYNIQIRFVAVALVKAGVSTAAESPSPVLGVLDKAFCR